MDRHEEGPGPSSSPRIIRLSPVGWISCAGVLLVICSLLLPAVKSGHVLSGWHCFAIAIPLFPYSLATIAELRDVALAIIFGTLGNLTASFILLMLIDRERPSETRRGRVAAGLLAAFVVGLLLAPLLGRRHYMQPIESYLAGYFVWIAGLGCIAASGFWPERKRAAETVEGTATEVPLDQFQ